MIKETGGTGEAGGRCDVQIERPVSEERTTINIDFEAVFNGIAPDPDIRAGDWM